MARFACAVAKRLTLTSKRFSAPAFSAEKPATVSPRKNLDVSGARGESTILPTAPLAHSRMGAATTIGTLTPSGVDSPCKEPTCLFAP
jgi:hypothetical protein